MSAAPLPIVLVPGLQADHWSWVFQVRHFSPTRSVIVPAGQQSLPSIAEMADHVMAQLPPRFHLVAWSMGGYIAFHMLPQLQGRMASLVCIATSARPEDAETSQKRRALMALAGQEGMLALARQNMANSVLDIDRLSPDLCDALIKSAAGLGLDAYLAQQQAIMTRPDARPNLRYATCPTLVIVGTDDTTIPPERGREIHAAIAGARLALLEACGHCPPLEQPEAVNGLLDAWFAAHDANVAAAENTVP
jgi:pimeloyl-ACP methyl ester carboxylesterase